MGLEAINFFFRSEEQIEYSVASHKDITHIDGKKYAHKKDNDYWIDIEFQDPYSLSLRITLCNPREPVLVAFHHLLLFLFSFKNGTLMDMTTKQVYKAYNNEIREALERSYLNKKKVFENMYGNYTAAIGSEEFYKRQNKISNRKE